MARFALLGLRFPAGAGVCSRVFAVALTGMGMLLAAAPAAAQDDPAGGQEKPAEGASAEPAGQKGSGKASRKGRRDAFTFEGEVIRGDVQKPEVSYVIYRQELSEGIGPSLHTTFIPDLVGSVEVEPF
ncbi:hypothetical protein L6R50_03875 [Myxococcota bacterium]|nr:hypothetical protein [Myxococcota bacterium]